MRDDVPTRTERETQDPMGLVYRVLEDCPPDERSACAELLISEGHDAETVGEALEWLVYGSESMEDEPAVLEIHATTGRYLQVLQGLGAGAQGTVDVAYDQYLDRHVAIKRFHNVGLTRLDVVRREATALARILHPAVATVFDVIETADDFGIVMQLSAENVGNGEALSIDQIGRPLCSSADDEPTQFVHPRSVQEALEWVATVSDGLMLVHDNAVSHRDIKPDNILVTFEGRAPMLVDFGIAVMDAVPDGLDASERKVDQVGTVPWMAPEVARRDAKNTTQTNQRIDIYCLGATLFTLLAGHAPQCQGGVPPDLLKLRGKELHAPLNALTMTRFPVGARLSNIVEKAMNFDPEARYETPAELAVDLHRYLRGEATSVDNDWTRLLLYARSQHVMVALLTLGFLVVLLGAALAPGLLRQSDVGLREVRILQTEAALRGQANALVRCRNEMWETEDPAEMRAMFELCKARLDQANELWDEYQTEYYPLPEYMKKPETR